MSQDYQGILISFQEDSRKLFFLNDVFLHANLDCQCEFFYFLCLKIYLFFRKKCYTFIHYISSKYKDLIFLHEGTNCKDCISFQYTFNDSPYSLSQNERNCIWVLRRIQHFIMKNLMSFNHLWHLQLNKFHQIYLTSFNL